MKLQLNTKSKYILAVSGGADSMAMLQLFIDNKPSVDFSVVTVNHHLRENAQNDVLVVQNHCLLHNVPYLVVDIDVLEYCKQNKVSIETGARELRYQEFSKLSADYISLAHHREDNAETILMNLLRGSSLTGVTGMSTINGRYFRPLLNYSKQQLVDYCKNNNVPFVVDETNSDNNFTRNYVRNVILPQLTKVNSNAVSNIISFSELAKMDDDFLYSLVPIDKVQFKKDSAKIPFEALNTSKPIAYRLLKEVFRILGTTQNIYKVHLDAILNLPNKGSGKTICLPSGFFAVCDYNEIVICKQQQTVKDFCVDFVVGTTQTPFGEVQVSINQQTNSLRFDMDKLPYGCVLRTVQEDDTFNKFGGGGTKKLNRYLTDKKVAKREREKLLVVAKDNKVYLIVGVEIAEDIKTDEKSSKIYFIGKGEKYK